MLRENVSRASPDTDNTDSTEPAGTRFADEIAESTATCSDMSMPLFALNEYQQNIDAFVGLIQRNVMTHSYVLQGIPGLGKSTAIEMSLKARNLPYQLVGSYSTALGLYLALFDASDKIVVLDDASGIFTNNISMSILKAATWSSAGTDGKRIVKWVSTSNKVPVTDFDFTGKILLLCNNIPKGNEMQAFLDRSYVMPLKLSENAHADLLRDAANSGRFQDIATANMVADYLINNREKYELSQLNYRTLEKCYELALAEPERWQKLFDLIAPKDVAKNMVITLSQSGMKPTAQALEFMRTTGQSLRTFYYLREKLGLKN